MRSDLLRRLEKLEKRLRPPALPLLRTIWITDRIDDSHRRELANGERIVVDWYSEANSEILARERITADPNDEGRHCEASPTCPHGYSELAAPLILENHFIRKCCEPSFDDVQRQPRAQ